jgi:hypothetical protein
MKKIKNKKIYKISRLIWLLMGVLIVIWNIYWFVKVEIMNDYSPVINLVLYTIGISLLAVYTAITLLILFIKWLKFLRLKNLETSLP